MSSLNSLGLGSDGVLSYDVIDQLRAVDESGQITPIETKLKTNTTKTTDLSSLTIMAASLKTTASVLSDEVTYLTRSISNNGDSADVTVESGAAIQNFSIDVQNLATRDIYQSKSYTNMSDTFSSGDDTLTIDIGNDSFDMEVTAATTLTELKDLINDNSDGKVIASILNVGGNDPYKLVIKSTDTGEDNAINFSSTGTVVSDLGLNTNTFAASTPTGSYGSDDTLTFNVNDTDYTIDVLSTDTITEIDTKIQALGLSDELSSSVEDGILVLTSNDSDISISGLSASTFGLDNLKQKTGIVQKASDSSFLYNGVTINRSSNTIDDLIAGVSIDLKNKGITRVDITQNTEKITETLNSFVSKYNELMSSLNESIKYDNTTRSAGTFQGVSQVISLKTTINRELLSTDTVPRTEDEIVKLLEKGASENLTRSEIGESRTRSLEDYGITLNRTGYLEFDQEVYNAKMAENPDDIESFFRGYKDTETNEEVDGFFTKLNSSINNYIDGDDSILGLYETQLATEKKTLETQKTKAIASLDSKYAIMAKRFAAYDSIISGLNTQFKVLDSMIQAQYVDK